jgi:hypothetical protein
MSFQEFGIAEPEGSSMRSTVWSFSDEPGDIFGFKAIVDAVHFGDPFSKSSRRSRSKQNLSIRPTGGRASRSRNPPHGGLCRTQNLDPSLSVEVIENEQCNH